MGFVEKEVAAALERAQNGHGRGAPCHGKAHKLRLKRALEGAQRHPLAAQLHEGVVPGKARGKLLCEGTLYRGSVSARSAGWRATYPR